MSKERMEMMVSEKTQRVEHCNQLIAAIASHGRQFFRSRAGDLASFEVDAHGAIWYRDDYTRTLIQMGKRNRWNGFSHGGTLRSLVAAMYDYIETGEALDRSWIGLQRGDGSNIWGYDEDAMAACRAACFALPMFAPESA